MTRLLHTTSGQALGAALRTAARLATLALASVSLASGSNWQGRAEPGVSGATVRFLASRGAVGDWSSYVAAELGYFKDEGISFQSFNLERPGDIATALVSGRGDLATSSLPLVIAAALAGAPMKLISATQKATPHGGYDNWWATLPSSPINKPADLRGRKVHIYSQNSLAQAVTREVLAQSGLGFGEYQEVAMGFAQAYSALEGGLVDTALFIEPFYSRYNELSRSKYGAPLKVIYTYLTDFPQGLDLSGMIVNTDFAAKNPDTVRGFIRASMRAAKWGNAHPDELKKIIAGYTGVPYQDIKNMIPAEMSEDGRFFPGMLDRLQGLIIKYKMIPNFTSPLPERAFVDLSYLPAL
jgi:NitT/TauT family transport system substrate-binding protein